MSEDEYKKERKKENQKAKAFVTIIFAIISLAIAAVIIEKWALSVGYYMVAVMISAIPSVFVWDKIEQEGASACH